MEEIIQQMLSNQISMRAFLDVAFSNPDLISYINALVPEDAKDNPQHPFWAITCYDTIKKYDYKPWNFIKKIARFDGSLGDNLNIFDTIRRFYCYSHPDFQCTEKYEEEFGLLLDVAGERYGGSEVDRLINDIIAQYVSVTPKTRRIREAKEKLALTFHGVGKKRPYWINGAEWPMGTLSPMQYIDAKPIDDGKVYRFLDVDTGEIREVVQYY